MEKTKAAFGDEGPRDESQELLVQKLPKEISWDGRLMCKYQDLWIPTLFLKHVINFQTHFQAKDSDIIVASLPKSGTTWMKALVFSIVNRRLYSIHRSPLLTSNPHSLVPFLEYEIFGQQENPDLGGMPSPRLFAAHVHYKALPQSIMNSKCRIIYISRNPLDNFISHRHFVLENPFPNLQGESLPIDKAFDLFCEGIHPFGPFWEHISGYWQASLDSPEKVLFLKYEELKKDTNSSAKKIAEFLGIPFSKEEEEEGLVEEITKLCSFENLKNLEVNVEGATKLQTKIKNSSYFRKGQVGDWVNYLTPSMAERVDSIMKDKFGESLRFS